MDFFFQVVIGAALQQAFGMLWYGRLNGNLFFELAYKSSQPPSSLNLSLCNAISAISAFGLNGLLKILIDASGVHSIFSGIGLALVFWSFTFLLYIPHVFYENRPLLLALLHELYHISVLVLLSVYYVLQLDSW